MPDIKGLGPSKANALLERFGSVEGIRDADLSEITEIKGIGDGLARQLKRELGG
jgi:excinuclease ABC subunit C